MTGTHLQVESDFSLPVLTGVTDLSSGENGMLCSPGQQDAEHCDLTPSVGDLDSHRYDLRPRLAPQITSDWSTYRWTNAYHTDRLDLK